MKIYRKVFVTLSLVLLPLVSVHAEKDLNNLLKGTYAQNEEWACIDSIAPFPSPCPDCWSHQATVAGKITYNGDGTAYAEGRYSTVNNTNSAGDIGTYTCDWDYIVNTDRSFFYEGQCSIESLLTGAPPSILTNQKWYGHIGKSRKTLLLNRHDIEIEGVSLDGGISNSIESVCGKTSTQIKIRKENN